MNLIQKESISVDLNTISICSGVAGLEQGLRLAVPAFRIVCYIEREFHAAAILEKRMEEKRLDPAPIWSDLKTFNSRPWRKKVHCIIGGYPCQPFSIAGRQLADQDPSHLWPHIKRLVEEVQPDICFFENVEGHIKLGLFEVIQDLRGLGYQVECGLFSSEIAGAPHIRKRVFILAHAPAGGDNLENTPRLGRGRRGNGTQAWDQGALQTSGSRSGFPSLFPPGRDPNIPEWKVIWEEAPFAWPNSEPELLRMADGLAPGLDIFEERVLRLRAVGNSVSPIVCALAFTILAQRAGILG